MEILGKGSPLEESNEDTSDLDFGCLSYPWIAPGYPESRGDTAGYTMGSFTYNVMTPGAL